jgi:hypothetical protein
MPEHSLEQENEELRSRLADYEAREREIIQSLHRAPPPGYN